MSGTSQYSYLKPEPKIGVAFFASIAIHVGIVGALLFWPSNQPAADTLRERAIVTRLVKLGRELPREALPRMDSYQPPAPENDSINVSKDAQITDAQRKKDEKKQRDEFAKLMAKSIQNMVKKTTARGEMGTGSPDGSPNGDAAEASQGDAYLTQVDRYIRNNYVIPSIITESERKNLRATLVIYIDASGKLVKSVFEKRSGNPHFDNALESAVKKASPFPAPPRGLAKQYRDQGVELNFSI